MGTRGPAPDPNAIRRDRPDDQATWVDLPSRREGPTPSWPFPGQPHPDSLRAILWAELWTMPQAVMWERQRRHIEVALYVDTLADIQAGPPPDVKVDPTPALRTLAIRQAKELVLTSSELNRMRWRIGTAEPAKEAVKSDGRRSPSVKDRFKVIQGDAAS